MKISDAKFREGGVLESERLVFQVLQDDDVGQYAVFHTRLLGEDSVSSAVKNVYWFPDKPVKKGDIVVLYTKIGAQSEKKNTDGTTSHFFYWGLKSTLWQVKSECAVLARIETWNKAVVS